MQTRFSSKDFGALVLGRAALKKDTTAQLEISVQRKLEKDATTENDLWQPVLEAAAKQSKLGRIAVLYDRHNAHAQEFFKKVDIKTLSYTPKNRRAEKELQLIPLATEMLHPMANEGWGNTPEFRRAARKYIRQAKNCNADTLLWAEAIMGEENTQKALRAVTGPQKKSVFVCDFIPESKTGKTRSISIQTGDTPEKTQTRAAQILKTQLKPSAIQA